MTSIVKKKEKKKVKVPGKEKSLIGKKRNTIIVTVILVFFSFGFFLGKISFDNSLDRFEIEYKSVELDMNSVVQRVSFIDYLGDDFCDNSLITTLGSDLFKIGNDLVELEKNKEIDTKKYNVLKQKYNVNQVLFYSILKKYKFSCNLTDDVVLFFFESSKDSIEQGKILNQIYQNYSQIKIISMDYNYTDSLKYFYDYYDVQELPFIVINYNKTFSGLVPRDVLQKSLVGIEME